MRLVIDSLIAVMVLGVVAGLVVMHGQRKDGERDLADTQAALQSLHDRTAYQSTILSAMAGHQQVLVYVDPMWFGHALPVNLLASPDRPWIDLAPPGDLNHHPPDPIAYDSSQASFWYNPTLGVFRARVEPQLSEAKTLELYNQVNGTGLVAFDPAPSPTRTPMAHVANQPPSQQYASLAAGWDSAAPADDEPTDAPPTTQHQAAPPSDNAPSVVHDVTEIIEVSDKELAPADGDASASPASADRPTLRK